MKLKAVFILLFTTASFITKANVKLPVLFQSNMVLQRDKPCKIWGTAANGEKVSLSFKDEVYTPLTVNGKWELKLPAQPAGGPYTIIIQGNKTIALKKVLFGEV